MRWKSPSAVAMAVTPRWRIGATVTASFVSSPVCTRMASLARTIAGGSARTRMCSRGIWRIDWL